MVPSRSGFIFVTLTFVTLLGQSSPNPIDSILDPFGLFSSPSGEADASSSSVADSNSIDGKHIPSVVSRGPSSSLDAAAANSFAVDKSVHLPGGVDANLALSAADSLAISKNKNKDKIIDEVIILPKPKPYEYREPYHGPPVVYEPLPYHDRYEAPRPPPIYNHGPPRPGYHGGY